LRSRHEREPSARLSDLEASIIAVLIAQARNVGYKPLVDENVPALRLERLKYVARHYVRPDTLIAANALIVDYHAKLPLAIEWGGGEVASIDGLRFVVPRETIHARRNPRYFHRRRGVTALGTTADHYAGIHLIVVPGTPLDGTYLLDGLLDPQTSVRPHQIMADTAGYTDIMFGLYRLFSFQFSPRLTDTGGARFWVLDPARNYGKLATIATNRVDVALIRDCYEDILRVAGSLLQRETTGSELMRALRSHTRHLATLGRALAALGRVPKTIHLLDYCNDPIYRRAILGQLNRGDGRHELARRVPRQQRRAAPALPRRPGGAARLPGPRRQLHRPVEHALHAASARPARRPGIRDPPRRHQTAIAAPPRAPDPHRPLPGHPRRSDPTRRVPAPQDDRPRRPR
jgi:TnpA family transposase